MATSVAEGLGIELGTVSARKFPDGEPYVRIDTPVAGRAVVLVCTLHRPNESLLPLLLLAATARDLGAASVGLAAPYLAFMRQDCRFNPGEGVTAQYVARLISDVFDWMVTVDPHLHRLDSLDQIYTIPTRAVQAAPCIAAWVREHIEAPLLIGPDAESEQWVGAVAARADVPFLILQKERSGDREVEISVPDLTGHGQRTPVLVDDIISTAQTMLQTLVHLERSDLPRPTCIGVHGVFAEGAYEALCERTDHTITCNTIEHVSNRIDIDGELAAGIGAFLS
jgi:ribose-phosphate pyrophosphokinase